MLFSIFSLLASNLNTIFDEVLEVWQDKKGYSGIEHRNQSEFDDHVEFFDNLANSDGYSEYMFTIC